jgi:hypothetical protein
MSNEFLDYVEDILEAMDKAEISRRLRGTRMRQA